MKFIKRQPILCSVILLTIFIVFNIFKANSSFCLNDLKFYSDEELLIKGAYSGLGSNSYLSKNPYCCKIRKTRKPLGMDGITKLANDIMLGNSWYAIDYYSEYKGRYLENTIFLNQCGSIKNSSKIAISDIQYQKAIKRIKATIEKRSN